MESPLKIVMIETGGWGGMGQYSHCLCNALSKINSTEVILLTNERYELASLETNFKLEFFFQKDENYIKTILRLRRYLSQESPCLIHIQSLLSSRKDWASIFKKYLFPYKVVYTAHNILDHDCYDFLYNLSIRKIYKDADRIIVHAQQNRRELLETFNIDPAKIFVIDIGNYLFLSSVKVKKDEAREKFALSCTDKVVLFFGTIRRHKGLELLIRAFSEIVKRINNCRLLIAGKPISVCLKDYTRLIQELGLQGHVLFKPEYIPLEELCFYFGASDVVVLPYIKTYQSAVVQLAYAFDKPIVASNVGGLPEVIDDGKSGYIVEPNNISELARATIEILMDDNLREKMQNYIKEMITRRFSWEAIARKTKEVYKSIGIDG